MKKSFLKKLSLGLAAVMTVASLSACGKDNTSSDGANTETGASESTEVSTSTGADTLVVGKDTFGSKFSPFFATLQYDQDVSDMVSIGLLASDREGNIVMKGIEGETIAYNGTDYTYTGIADCDVTQNDDGTVVYDFTLRDDIKFSDGEPLTADDVIFSMYVFADPTYDGAATFYTLPIKGMEDYRSGMDSLGNIILAAGRDNTDFTTFTEDQMNAYWAAVDEEGEKFAQDIVDYCVANYPDYLESVGNSEVALGMFAWGFGDVNDDGTVLTGAGTGTEYNIADLTIADYWTELQAKYENDLVTMSETEAAGDDLFTMLNEDYPEFTQGITTGDSAANISGIEKTGDYSLRVTMDKFDAVAIYQLGVAVAPLHYYGDTSKYDYDNNMFGFTKGDLSSVKDKTTQPLGAGPYKFDSYENGVVTFTANENYYKGEPKIKTILFKETPESDKLTGVASGTFDISDPSMSVDVLKNIKNYNSNGEVTGDVLTTDLVDNLGYGYIGINANVVKVGDDKASEASKDLRKAFATIFAAYRDTVINSYYGEMATVIQYPMSNTSWAAPKPADEGYQIAYSVDADGNSIYTADMTDEQKYEAALQASISFFKAAGYTFDEATGKFTAAPEGAEMTYEVIIPGGGTGDHPAFGILTAAKEALATIGITLQINDPSDSSVWNNALEANTAEMWAGAWGATVDPDMYQVYHSDNANGKGTNSNHYSIEDADLDEMIIAARNSADQSYRKATYKECLETILDWGVEIPTYQRQNAVVISTERVNVSTMTPDITTFWGWTNDIEKLEMN
ncbi:MAG: ABC transporter substrate-binding protein [Clostridium sp.]|nr:ABC transporter substrate-binding protein [Clostridium sp.]